LSTDYFEEAYRLAYTARASCRPNPAVGALIVAADGKVIGKGATAVIGWPHAEVNAIVDAGGPEKVAGASLYVTLDPCVHFGRTPPCTDLIIQSKIKSVHVALADIDERVFGKSEKILNDQGISYFYDFPEDLKEKCFELNRDYYYFKATKQVLISVKWASTLDGKLASSIGDSKWISHEVSRQKVQEIRYTHDAILVGSKTALQDRAQLTVRRTPSMAVPPIRIVLDKSSELPLDLPIFNQDTKTVVVYSDSVDIKKINAVTSLGHVALTLPLSNQQFDLKSLVLKLQEEFSIRSLLVEGGASIFGSFFDAEIVERFHTFIAPKLLIDAQATSVITGKLARPLMSMAQTFDIEKNETLVDAEQNKDVYLCGNRTPQLWQELRKKVGLSETKKTI
jgi:diaminohydroxyphosphoribosylaminopyrimidine deaminase/5-amino-6-(5-phosphoribosylamino)uracil reductase